MMKVLYYNGGDKETFVGTAGEVRRAIQKRVDELMDAHVEVNNIVTCDEKPNEDVCPCGREDKVETNFDHYKDEIIALGTGEWGVYKGKIEHCVNISCNECELGGDCGGVEQVEWLARPYKPVSHIEKDTLVRCWNDDGDAMRYYSHYDVEEGVHMCFSGGATSFTAPGVTPWKHVEVVDLENFSK